MLSIIKILNISILSFVLTYIMIFFLRKIAPIFGLLDKPNARKIHDLPIPLIGGIAIAFSAAFSITIHPSFLLVLKNAYPILNCGFLLLFVGVLDDKRDLKAIYKLIIQLLCAYSVAASDIRITNLHGLFGIQDLSILMQYILTIVIITGVVNAFNLMDGIDGLAGGLFVIGFLSIAIIAFILGNEFSLIISVALVGSLLAFLRYNLSNKKERRIFMGDGGALSLSFLLVSFSIYLLEISKNSEKISSDNLLAFLFLLFTVPVFDSLRVYLGRMKAGNSPFKADKSHIHHLFLLLNLPHKKVSFYIILFCAYLLIIGGVTLVYFSPIFVILTSIATFILLTYILSINKKMLDWKQKLEQMEKI